MVRPCCICGVKRNGKADTDGVRFFQFPSVKSATYAEWINAIRRHTNKPHFNSKKSSIVCAKHFTDDCFNRSQKRMRLNEGAVPTLFDVPKGSRSVTKSAEPNASQQDSADGKNKGEANAEGTSESLSPPSLLLPSEYNSDFEADVEDPPDLDIYSANSMDGSMLTSFCDAEMIKMDHIGSVGDILGSDSGSLEGSFENEGRPQSTEERDEVDGQTILSFSSVQEMEEYIQIQEASQKYRLNKSIELRRSKDWKEKPGLPGQPTPSVSPSPCPSPAEASSSNGAPDVSDTTSVMPPASPPTAVEEGASCDGPKCSGRESEGSTTAIHAPPELERSGNISEAFAKYAATAVPPMYQHPRRVTSHTARKTVLVPGTKRGISPSKKEEVASNVPSKSAIVDEPVYARDTIPVVEEPYEEAYDVPGNSVAMTEPACGRLFCRLGCVCESLDVCKRKKPSLQHCNMSECMLGCVCGYKPNKPSSRKTFVKLLKGNEAFYSKINWTNERSRRERRVPERFSEFHLDGKDALLSSSFADDEIRTRPYPRGRGAGKAAASQATGPPNQTPANAIRKPEPFRLKIQKDEMSLLRWDSYVSLKKVYVAPDQEIMCMDHNKYNCPCITANRRIMRIASKYIPPNIRFDSSSKELAPTSNGKTHAKPAASAGRSVARKHTHPIMRTAHQRREHNGALPAQPVKSGSLVNPTPAGAKPVSTAMSKMWKLLQEDHLQFQKLMKEEKARAFDDEVDLTIRTGQSIQLVAWIRFHNIYQSGNMHVRYLNRRNGPVILVMKPSEIVAADITRDIQDMKGSDDVPEIVTELLNPFISPEETSRYAFLLCDGVKWELVGCISLKSPPSPSPSSEAPLPAVKRNIAPKPQVYESFPSNVEVPDVILEEQIFFSPPKRKKVPVPGGELRTAISPAHPPSAAVSLLPATLSSPPNNFRLTPSGRSNQLELRRLQLEERLKSINSKLGTSVTAVKSVAPGKMSIARPKMRLLPPPPALNPATFPAASLIKERPKSQPNKVPDEVLGPEICILPDDVGPTVDTAKPAPAGAREAVAQLNAVHQPGQYPAAEKLAKLSELFKKSQHLTVSPVKTPPAVAESISVRPPQPIDRQTPKAVVFPISYLRPGPPSLLKLQPITPTAIFPTAVRPIRILSQTPQSQQPLGTVIRLSALNPSTVKIDDKARDIKIIQMQRRHWSTKGVVLPLGQKQCVPMKPTVFSQVTPPVPKLVPLPGSEGEAGSANPQPASQVGGSSSPNPTALPEKPSSSDSVSSTPEWQPVIMSTETLRGRITPEASKEQPKSNAAVATGTPDATTASPAIAREPPTPVPTVCPVFPTPLQVDIVTAAQPANGGDARQVNQRLKIMFEGLKIDGVELCPASTSMILPLDNLDDRWCMVAIDKVAGNGLNIPGMSVFIPRGVVERAASTALERKARVSFPLHVQGNAINPILKKGFGVYGTPQMPRHVFLGPFPAGYIDGCSSPLPPCLMQIPPAKPKETAPAAGPVPDGKDNEPQPALAEPKADVGVPVPPATTEAASDHLTQAEEDDASRDHSDSEANNLMCNSSNSLTSSPGSVDVAVSPYKRPPKLDDANTEDAPYKRRRVSEGSDHTNGGQPQWQTGVRDSLARQKRGPSTLYSTPEAQKPMRIFVARTEGLPATTVAVMDSGKVVVKHPYRSRENMTFDSIDNAKRWLQWLVVQNASRGRVLKSSRPVAGEAAAARSNRSRKSPEEPESRQLHLQPDKPAGKRVIEAEGAATPSPKRIRKLTEKARILAAENGRSSSTSRRSRTNTPEPGEDLSFKAYAKSAASTSEADGHPALHAILPTTTKRRADQQQMHIKKEQERRGMLAVLFRELDSVIAPNSGHRPKIVILKHATLTIAALKAQQTKLDATYGALKKEYMALCRQRQRIFAELPAETRNVFSCLMDAGLIPIRHKSMTEASSKRALTIDREATAAYFTKFHQDTKVTAGPETSNDAGATENDSDDFDVVSTGDGYNA